MLAPLIERIVMMALVGVMFVWKQATHLTTETETDALGVKRYTLHGPLFFASVSHFRDLFKPEADPAEVVVDFYYSRVYDQSALEAIDSLAERYVRAGKRLRLQHLSPECRDMLDRAKAFIEVEIHDEQHFHISAERFRQRTQDASHEPAPAGGVL